MDFLLHRLSLKNLDYSHLQAVQKLIDEEFQGIVHLRTSTLHKKIASARHDFIKLSGSENKLEALLQVYFCSDLSYFSFYQQSVMVTSTNIINKALVPKLCQL
jgi:hypothetical protein